MGLRWHGVALLVLVACGGDSQSVPDARVDATPADAAVADAPAPDATPDATPDAAPPDAAPDAAPPATLLLTDTGLAMINLVAIDGTVLDSWPSPVAGPTGVALDRRALDGFWVQGTGAPSLAYKVGWDGTTITTRTNPWGVSGTSVRGLDFYLDPTATASDTLIVAHTNTTPIEVISGFRVSDGGAEFQYGFFMSGVQSGFWGVHMVEWTASTNTVRSWMSRHTTDEIERWSTGIWEAEYPIAVTDARGLTMTPAGEFYVVDDATNTVVHLSATGATLGSFATPGTQPAGISYAGTSAPVPIP